jgi:pimeloyl-ACP methyl ester carboxylesterase
MKHVTSKDGTRVAYEKTGSGPGLIVIGGALGDHRFYTPLAAELARHFTVCNFDRRGRGQSEDTQPYAIERELEDLTALIDQAGAPVRVYGHSAGSAFAIRAAAAGMSIAKLVLADPPFRPPAKTTRKRACGTPRRRPPYRRCTTRAITAATRRASSAASGCPPRPWRRCSAPPPGR